MPASKAQQKATNKYIAKAYDRINLTVPKGKKDIIQAHAEARSESVNGFINRAISETIERDQLTPETYIGRNAKALRIDFEFEDSGMERHGEKELGGITHILSLAEVKELEKQYQVSPFCTEIIYEIEHSNEFHAGGNEKVKVHIEYFSERSTPQITIGRTM